MGELTNTITAIGGKQAMRKARSGAAKSPLDRQVMKPCPCGKTPTTIGVGNAGQGYKWALAYPDCCGEWMIEFRTVNYDLESDATEV